jgi:hypothetical protein
VIDPPTLILLIYDGCDRATAPLHFRGTDALRRARARLKRAGHVVREIDGTPEWERRYEAQRRDLENKPITMTKVNNGRHEVYWGERLVSVLELRIFEGKFSWCANNVFWKIPLPYHIPDDAPHFETPDEALEYLRCVLRGREPPEPTPRENVQGELFAGPALS